MTPFNLVQPLLASVIAAMWLAEQYGIQARIVVHEGRSNRKWSQQIRLNAFVGKVKLMEIVIQSNDAVTATKPCERLFTTGEIRPAIGLLESMVEPIGPARPQEDDDDYDDDWQAALQRLPSDSRERIFALEARYANSGC